MVSKLEKLSFEKGMFFKGLETSLADIGYCDFVLGQRLIEATNDPSNFNLRTLANHIEGFKPLGNTVNRYRQLSKEYEQRNILESELYKKRLESFCKQLEDAEKLLKKHDYKQELEVVK